MHPLLRDIMSHCDHAHPVPPVTIHHVPRPVALQVSRCARVPLGDIPPAAAVQVPVVKPFGLVQLTVPSEVLPILYGNTGLPR